MEYDGYSPSGSGLEVLLAFAGIFFVALLISYIFNSVALMLMFKKANHPQSWGAWVPFYNTYLLYKFGGQQPIWFWIYLGSILLNFIPFIGSLIAFAGSIATGVALVYSIVFINKSFGKGEDVVLWTLFGFFLLPVWALVLGLGSSTYQQADGPLLLNKEGYPPEPW